MILLGCQSSLCSLNLPLPRFFGLKAELVLIRLFLLFSFVLEVCLVCSEYGVPVGKERTVVPDVVTVVKVVVFSTPTHRQQAENTPTPFVSTMSIRRLPNSYKCPEDDCGHVDLSHYAQDFEPHRSWEHIS